MCVELSIRDLQIIVNADEVGFTNFLRSRNVEVEKHEDGVLLFHARCFESDFQYVIQRRFLEGYSSYPLFSRNSEDSKEYGVQDLFQQSQVLLEKQFGLADYQDENNDRGTKNFKWKTELFDITHRIGERFMLYELITIKSPKDVESKLGL